MAGGKAVNANVLVFDATTGRPTLIEKGQVPPAAVRDQLGDHLFVETNEQEAGSGVPPRAGKGSGKEAWAAYAEANGVEVDADASRDDIIAACEAAGVPVE